jgi:hypothetical protein
VFDVWKGMSNRMISSRRTVGKAGGKLNDVLVSRVSPLLLPESAPVLNEATRTDRCATRFMAGSGAFSEAQQPRDCCQDPIESTKRGCARILRLSPPVTDASGAMEKDTHRDA